MPVKLIKFFLMISFAGANAFATSPGAAHLSDLFADAKVVKLFNDNSGYHFDSINIEEWSDSEMNFRLDLLRTSDFSHNICFWLTFDSEDKEVKGDPLKFKCN